MINLFAPSSNDQSLIYLYKIFGGMNSLIPAPAGDVDDGGLTILGTMFQTFNSVILAVGALMVVYITVVGIMNTAHEGQFMGKNWNNLWIPIRVVLGIGAMVPTSSGFSGIQIVMMWAIMQGIGAADVLWSKVLDHVNFAGSVYATVSIQSTESKQTMKTLFQGIMCMRSAAATLPNPVPDNGREGAYYCGANASSSWCRQNPWPFKTYTAPVDGRPWELGPDGSCGTVQLCNPETSCAATGGDPAKSGPSSLKCQACQAEIEFLSTVAIPTFISLSDAYILNDFNYTQFYAASLEASGESKDYGRDADKKAAAKPAGASTKPQPPVPDFVTKYCSEEGVKSCVATELPSPNDKSDFMSAPNTVIKELYWPYGLKPAFKDLFKGKGNEDDIVSQMTIAYSEKLQKLVDGQTKELTKKVKSDDLFEKARASGWILAGSYYHMLANANKDNMKDSMPTFSTVEPRSEHIAIANTSKLYHYRNNYTAAKRLMGLAGGGGGDTESVSGAAGGAAADGTADAMGGFATLISGFGGANPLVQVIQFGLMLMNIALAVFLTFVIIMLILSIVANIMIQVLGTGLDVNPLGAGMTGIIIILYPIFLFFVGTLISVGGLLGVYVPLIPFVLFTMGGVGWMINVVEAMVAGPLVALGILSPSGHHELLGKAEPALGMLFALFLRPSLMLFGMITAMLTAPVAVMLVNAGFHNVLITMYDFGGKGAGATAQINANPIILIMILSAYVSLIISVLNKCFSAIYIIPQQVMGWIGLQGASYGEGEALGKMEGSIGAAGGQAAATMGKVQPKGGGGDTPKGDASISGTKTPVQPGKGGEGPSLPGQSTNHPKK